MRFLLAENTLPDPNQGASGCDLAIIQALRDLGHQVDELWGPDLPRRIRHANLHQWLELPRRYANAIALKCASQIYDVIQVSQPHAYLAAKEHRRHDRPGLFVNRSHGWEPYCREALKTCPNAVPDGRPFWRRLVSELLWWRLQSHNELALHYSDGVVVYSQDDREYITDRHRYPPDHVLALAPGVPNDYLAMPAPCWDADRSRRLLYVAQFAPFKGPEVVAAVVNDVLEKNSVATMTWVCALRHHAEVRNMLRVHIRSRVTLLDWMPRDRLREVYDRHGLFLFPSHSEGFGIVFLEAMARGLCVLATRVGGMREVIRSGDNGFLFDRADAPGLAMQTLMLLDNPIAGEAVSRNARQTAMRYTWERAARELLAFYERLRQAKADKHSVSLSPAKTR